MTWIQFFLAFAFVSVASVQCPASTCSAVEEFLHQWSRSRNLNDFVEQPNPWMSPFLRDLYLSVGQSKSFPKINYSKTHDCAWSIELENKKMAVEILSDGHSIKIEGTLFPTDSWTPVMALASKAPWVYSQFRDWKKMMMVSVQNVAAVSRFCDEAPSRCPKNSMLALPGAMGGDSQDSLGRSPATIELARKWGLPGSFNPLRDCAVQSVNQKIHASGSSAQCHLQFGGGRPDQEKQLTLSVLNEIAEKRNLPQGISFLKTPSH